MDAAIHFSGVKKGDKVAVAGYEGLGHMAVQYLVDLGADVTIFDRMEEKRIDALRMGATHYVNGSNTEEMKVLNSHPLKTNFQPPIIFNFHGGCFN